MNRRKIWIGCAILLVCQCLDAHEEGEPISKAELLVSLGLTSGGAVLVTLTLLALAWQPIDAGFRRSQFRARWENRSTRVAFALGIMILSGLIVGGLTYWRIGGSKSTRHPANQFQPAFGGEVQIMDRFAIEMVARRTGELRLYVSAVQGRRGMWWDIHATASVPAPNAGGAHAAQTILPMKSNSEGSYLLAVTVPFQESELPVHLSVKIDTNHFELDYRLPVQD